jgi:tRNA nucleotidyltransferase/poly(A) polymerase
MESLRDNICAYVNEVGRAIGAKFYLVGGTVRDEILGVPVNDWDMVATGLSWDELIAAMKPFGRTEATGESFNVIRHFPNVHIGTPYIEVALPRREYSTGPKTTDVDAKYDPHMAIEDDLMRRDYSINSMARDCETLELIDPFNGVGDLEAGVLRMLHPDSARDDSLRIIRGIRFMGRFGFSVTPETDKQLRDNVDLLFAVSGERFQKELLELVTSPHVDTALRYMQSIGALKELFPELEEGVGCTQNQYHDHDVWEHTVRVVTYTPSTNPYVRLGALFHDISKPRVKWTRPDGRTHFYMPEKGDEFAPGGEPQVRGNHERRCRHGVGNHGAVSPQVLRAAPSARSSVRARAHVLRRKDTPGRSSVPRTSGWYGRRRGSQHARADRHSYRRPQGRQGARRLAEGT